MEGRRSEETKLCPLSSRFYIESISFLKDKTTVELFFLNAKACVHKVRAGEVGLRTDGQTDGTEGAPVFPCSNEKEGHNLLH